MTTIISNLQLTDLSVTNPIGTDNPPKLVPVTIDEHAPTQHKLSETDFAVDWQDILTDEQLDKLTSDGWMMIDKVFGDKALLALQSESGFVEYRAAELAAGIRVSQIRGDNIRWITKDFFAGFYYLQSINALAAFFNRNLFAGIRHSEAHYACYPSGFGYQWHGDNPKGRDERVISAVFYLNDDWETADGGALEIIDNHGRHHFITPTANRLIVFDSNLQHCVQIAHRPRYSIATWMRRDGLMPFVKE